MNQQTCKAIETLYNGYRFRSRTEARWAVFMDNLGVPYIYEKEGYDLGEAGWYLPDFWLPVQDCWLEIKPDRATEEEWKKVMAISKQTGKMAFIFYECSPPRHWWDHPPESNAPFNHGNYYAPDGDWDQGRGVEFGVCWECGKVCIGYLGGHRIYCPEVYDYKGECEGQFNFRDVMHPRVTAAYTAARSARFEHGEAAKGVW